MAGLGGVTGGLGGLEHRRSVEPSSVRPRRPSFSLSLRLKGAGAGAGGPLLPLFGRILMTDGNWEGRGCGWHLYSPLSIADCQVRRAAKLCQRLRVRVCEAASRRTLPCPSLNFAPSSSSRPIATCSMDGTHFQLASMQTKFQMLPLKTASQACISTRSFRKEHFNGMLQLVMVEESCKRGHLQLITGPSLEQVRSEKLPADKIEEYISYDLDEGLQDKSDIATDSAEGRVNICDREMERRRKIGLANKGRTPWNKGRKHNQETRELIKKRTIEAMRDPKVMSC